MSDRPTPKKKNPGKRVNASGVGAQKSKPSASKHPGTSGAAQSPRLLERLRKAPLTTWEAQRKLDVYAPPARVHQLRSHGHLIDTVWTHDETEAGISHRVGLYVLRKEAA